MTESVKDLLRKFYIKNEGKAFASYELKKIADNGGILYFDGSKISSTERSLHNRSYEIVCEKIGVTSRHRKVEGVRKPYMEFGYNIGEGDLLI